MIHKKKKHLQISLGDQNSTDEGLISIMLNPPWAVTLVMPFSLIELSHQPVSMVIILHWNNIDKRKIILAILQRSSR